MGHWRGQISRICTSSISLGKALAAVRGAVDWGTRHIEPVRHRQFSQGLVISYCQGNGLHGHRCWAWALLVLFRSALAAARKRLLRQYHRDTVGHALRRLTRNKKILTLDAVT